MVEFNREEGRYRVLLIGVGDNTPEEKESFSQHISKTYSIPFLLLKKIVDRCPIVLKKNLSLKKAEVLAKNLMSFGASVSVEERRNSLPVSLEFQELVPCRMALDSAYLRRTERGMWSLIGRVKNIAHETLTDSWVLVQAFGDPDEFIAFEETPLAINPLPPGEISPFKVILEGDLLIRRISVAFKNASGEPIPVIDERKKREWVEVEVREGAVSSRIPSGRKEALQSFQPVEPSPIEVVHPDKELSGEPVLVRSPELEVSIQHSLSSNRKESEPKIIQEETVGTISEEYPLPLETPEEIPDVCLSGVDDNGQTGEQIPGEVRETDQVSPEQVKETLDLDEMSAEEVGDPIISPEQPEQAMIDPGTPAEPVTSPDVETPETSHLDASSFQEAGRLQENISETPVEIVTEEETEKNSDGEPSKFPWIDDFREAVKTFYQKPRNGFSNWFEECRKQGEFKDSLHALLTILVHSRFEQGDPLATALENTQRVSRLLIQPNIPLNQILPLEATPFLPGEVWRELFYRALPKIQQIGKTILERSRWKGFELECLIQVIPHMGQPNSRAAIRWFKELVPDVIEIDVSDTPVSIGEGFYRVASRLGILDPHFDQYRGTNSMADAKIQSFAKIAYPENPLTVEEPLTWTGNEEEQGGHCFPVQPKCNGCLFETFCPKLYLQFNPSEKGMREINASSPKC